MLSQHHEIVLQEIKDYINNNINETDKMCVDKILTFELYLLDYIEIRNGIVSVLKKEK